MSGKFGAFVAGGIIGAAAAFLFSPRNGEQNRAMVADKVNEAWGNAQQTGSQFQHNGQRVYDAVSNQAHMAANSATSAAQDAFAKVQDRIQTANGNMKPTFTDKNDELREKIEAARQRIAAQVQKNAEEADESNGQTIHVTSADDENHASDGQGETGTSEL